MSNEAPRENEPEQAEAPAIFHDRTKCRICDSESAMVWPCAGGIIDELLCIGHHQELERRVFDTPQYADLARLHVDEQMLGPVLARSEIYQAQQFTSEHVGRKLNAISALRAVIFDILDELRETWFDAHPSQAGREIGMGVIDPAQGLAETPGERLVQNMMATGMSREAAEALAHSEGENKEAPSA